MSLIPCGHRLLIKPQKIEDVDDGYKAAVRAGIIIPEAHERLQQSAVDKGTVITLGSTAFRDFGGEAWCSPGDLVAYARYGGKIINDPETNTDYLILNDEDIIAVIKQGNKDE